MDLTQINLTEAAEIGAYLELEHPVTGEKLDAIIHLAGTDSAEYRKKQKEIQSKRIAKMARGKKSDLTTSDDEECDLLASCTLGWRGIFNGKEEVKFSQAAAKKLYLETYWIREQVDAFIGDRANFFTNP